GEFDYRYPHRFARTVNPRQRPGRVARIHVRLPLARRLAHDVLAYLAGKVDGFALRACLARIQRVERVEVPGSVEDVVVVFRVTVHDDARLFLASIDTMQCEFRAVVDAIPIHDDVRLAIPQRTAIERDLPAVYLVARPP